MTKTLLTKAARGIQTGDVANSLIRNLLTLISKKIGAITDKDLLDAIDFFDYKCPYTGHPLPIHRISDVSELSDEEYEKLKEAFQLDHIVPQNRDFCGLNIKGNLVYVTKKANSKKAQKDFEEFIRKENTIEGLKDLSKEEREERIRRIKEFQKKTGYSKWNEKVIELRDLLNRFYNEVSDIQSQHLSELEKKGL